ncbi:MAG: hypothetical protein IKK57_01840 [Clostridia bacterium]|nr:hypothetical protein [Clostridia bacterium]
MRVIRRYRFVIGTKVPFTQWPEIVHRFLAESGLTYQRFLYHFTGMPSNGQTPQACIRLQRDCPEIGQSRIAWVEKTDCSTLITHVLTNMDTQTPFAETLLLPLMGKIHHSYGFVEVQLCYGDVDFFGSVMPMELEEDLLKLGVWQLKGSFITLYREPVFNRLFLDVNIDVLRGCQLLDATPYREAMQRLLPKVKVKASQIIALTADEKQRIDEVDRAAAPVITACKAYLKERLPGLQRHQNDPCSYSVARACKKLAKQYGYAYCLEWNGGVYSLQKRTARGNVLYIAVDSGRFRGHTSLLLYLKGVGFSHYLGCADHVPADQQELEAALDASMQIIADFEETMLPQLDECFPESPAWFEADMF